MNTSDKNRLEGEDFPVTGVGGDAPDFLFNNDLPDLPEDADDDLADLTVLMGQVRRGFNFRAQDLRRLDEKARRQLLIDMQEALGIKPLSGLSR